MLKPEVACELSDVVGREVPEDDRMGTDVLAGVREEELDVVRTAVTCLKSASGSRSRSSVSSGRRRFEAIQELDRVTYGGLSMCFGGAALLEDLCPSITKHMRISSCSGSALRDCFLPLTTTLSVPRKATCS